MLLLILLISRRKVIKRSFINVYHLPFVVNTTKLYHKEIDMSTFFIFLRITREKIVIFTKFFTKHGVFRSENIKNPQKPYTEFSVIQFPFKRFIISFMLFSLYLFSFSFQNYYGCQSVGSLFRI